MALCSLCSASPVQYNTAVPCQGTTATQTINWGKQLHSTQKFWSCTNGWKWQNKHRKCNSIFAGDHMLRMSWETGREKGKMHTGIENVKIICHRNPKKKDAVQNRDNLLFGKNRQEDTIWKRNYWGLRYLHLSKTVLELYFCKRHFKITQICSCLQWKLPLESKPAKPKLPRVECGWI